MRLDRSRAPLTFRHYPALDGLRGIAVLFVMLRHFVRSYDSVSGIHAFALQLTEFMWTGVDLFFVLSGFLITGILLETLRSTSYFRTFYLRRVLRIFPLYYGLLGIAFVVLPLIHISPSAESRANILSLLTFTSNFHFAFVGWGMNVFDVYWSLAVEEQFYLFWPLALLIVPTRYHKPLIYAGLAGGIVLRYAAVHGGSSAIFLYTMLPTHADGLLIGALIAMVIHERKRVPALSPAISTSILLLIGAFFLAGSFHVLGLHLYYAGWDTREAMFYYLAIAAAYGSMLYLSIVEGSLLQRIFEHPVLRRVGTYSYCLYLIHEVVVLGIHWLFAATGFASLLQATPAVVQEAAQLIPLFLVSFGLAALSWRMIERPIGRLKRYISYHQAQPELDVVAA